MNQNAILVEQSKFADLIASMGDDALYQRFTVTADAPREPAYVEAGKRPEATELAPKDPIVVSDELLTEFSFGSPDSPVIDKWLSENNIQPGEDVIVRINGKDGIVEKKVSTNRSTFFVPVDKLVDIETDDFDHAKFVGVKYAVGESVVVGRNVYGADNKPTGEKTPDAGWKVVGYGEKNGLPTTKIQKIDGGRVFEKEPTNAELEEMQKMYSPEVVMPQLDEAIVRKTGHQELESAGVVEPIPKADVEPSEATQPRNPNIAPFQQPIAESLAPAAELGNAGEEVVVQPEKPQDKKQERYNELKAAMRAIIEEASDTSAGYGVLDSLRIDEHARAVLTADYNAEARAVAGMSKKLIASDLVSKYADLYKQREDLFIRRP